VASEQPGGMRQQRGADAAIAAPGDDTGFTRNSVRDFAD
jgi:hypothetical protein